MPQNRKSAYSGSIRTVKRLEKRPAKEDSDDHEMLLVVGQEYHQSLSPNKINVKSAVHLHETATTTLEAKEIKTPTNERSPAAKNYSAKQL